MKKIGFWAALILIACNISCSNSATEKSGTGTADTAGTPSSAPAATAAVVPEGMGLMTKSDCMTCHNATAKIVGPSFADIAAKYPNTPENINKLSMTVINGSSGVWGAVPMPAHAGLSKPDAEKMTGYILSMNEKK